MSNEYMSDEMFNELVESMKQAVAIERGEMKPSRVFTYTPLDVKAIREKTNKTQADFAAMIGVKVGTLRNWEQGRRYPDGPAQTLLRIVSADPDYVQRVLYR